VFFLRQAAKKEAMAAIAAPHAAATPASPHRTEATQASQLQEYRARGPEAKPHDINYAAVIGGGTMGAGIVHALVRAGIPVRLIEVDPPAVSGALGRIKRMLDEDVAAGRSDRLAARHAFNRVAPTTQWTGLELADVLI